MAPDETWQSNFPESWLNLSEVQHVLLWRERPIAKSGRDEHPAVSTRVITVPGT